jgi:hypothetical protein
MDQLSILVRLHVALFRGILPIVIIVGVLSFIPQLVDTQFFSFGVHILNHDGGIDMSFEYGMDGDGVVKGDSRP